MEAPPIMVLIAIIAVLLVALQAIKAVAAVRLLERDPEAWEKLQEQEDKRRRQRQEAIGKALLAVGRFVESMFNRFSKERKESSYEP
jgi:hypothetical protein